MSAHHPSHRRIMLVSGMSGAGKSTALHTFEDLGWETVDNLPLSLFRTLIESPVPLDPGSEARPLAIGIDSRTRGFNADRLLGQIRAYEKTHGVRVEILFLDCADSELERRYSETRRRHPLALDRPAAQGIIAERERMTPLKRAAAHVIDTTDSKTNTLQQDLRSRFGTSTGRAMTLSLYSFGFARGILRNADLVFDMRFLRNPHWEDELRPKTGLDAEVGAFISEDSAFEEAFERIAGLLEMLLPRYQSEGKAYVTVGFGCTGGRHRSVFVAESMAERLRETGFSPTVSHRDLAYPPHDAVERLHAREDNDAGE